MISSVDALIADFDGVFVKSFDGLFLAYQDMCGKMGIPLFKNLDEFNDFYTVDYEKNYDNLGIHGERKEEAYNHIQNYMYDNYIEMAHFIPHVVDAVTRLECPIAICSTGEAKLIRGKLQGTELEKKIDIIVGRKMVKNIKPDPEPVLLAAELLGIPPERCAFLGDTRVDMQAGKAARVAKTFAAGWDGAYDSIEELDKENPTAILLAGHEINLFM